MVRRAYKIAAYLALGILGLGCGRVGFDFVSGDADPSTQNQPDSSVASCLSDPVDPGSGTFRVMNLRPDWSTPKVIGWVWEFQEGDGFYSEYEFFITDCKGFERSLTTADSLELASLSPRLMTFGLDPLTTYWGQVTGVGEDGLRYASNIASMSTTPDAQSEIVIFSDTKIGTLIPDTITVSNAAPYSGTSHYQWTSPASEFENVRSQYLNIDTSAVTETEFASAFVEFALATDLGAHSDWTEFRLWFDPNGLDKIAHFNDWPHPADNQYLVYQVPLSAFKPMRYEIFSSGLFEFAIGSNWSENQTVRIDEVRIRW